MKKKTFCFDLDNTLCNTISSQYEKSKPNKNAIKVVNYLYDQGHIIKINTARYMGRSNDNLVNKRKIHLKITKQPIYTFILCSMWALVILFIPIIQAHRCCPTCACSQRCETPQMHTNITTQGLHIHCRDADCACVIDELDTCAYGQTWRNHTLIGWHDARWNHCIKIEQIKNPFRATALVRWWRDKCMGHIVLDIEINTRPTTRDTYVDFNVVSFHEHTHIHNVFHIQTQSGCNDIRPMAGKSDMFFQAILTNTTANVHVEITNCVVQIIQGGETDAIVLNEKNVYDENNKISIQKGEKITYTAFWDEETNSPFQRLVCSYALYNGTFSNKTLIGNHVNSRNYKMVIPGETGITID